MSEENCDSKNKNECEKSIFKNFSFKTNAFICIIIQF